MKASASQVAEPHTRVGALPVQLQNAANLLKQVTHIVALTLLPEFTEVREVAANLRGTDAKPRTKITRRDSFNPFVCQVLKTAHINRQPPYYNIGDGSAVALAHTRRSGLLLTKLITQEEGCVLAVTKHTSGHLVCFVVAT